MRRPLIFTNQSRNLMKKSMAKARSIFWSRGASTVLEQMSLKELRRESKRLGQALTEPQRVDFHLLLFFEKGAGTHMVDFHWHDCRRGTLIHVSPNQVHAFGETTKNEATLLLFRPELLPDDFFCPETRACPPAECVWPPITELDRSSLEFVTTTLKFLDKQRNSLGVWSQPEIARHIAIGLASFAYRTCVEHKPLYQSQPQPLFLAFLTELESSFASNRDAKWYAEQLGCSYGNLSRVCKATSGETPKIIIDRRVLMEARRLLAFTGNNVSEIGAALGFTEPTNFVKFFQRLAGETPDAFRGHWQRS